MKPRILLVDDEPDMLNALGFRLEKAGYELVHAQNGTDALEQMKDRRADLILSDFMMPEMNGIELTRIVKSHPLWYSTEVVLCSCNEDPEFRRKAMALGAADYLPKSAGAKAILERVEKLLGVSLRASEARAASGSLALTESLVAMLEVARDGASNPAAARVAIDAAIRIAEDLRALMSADPPSDSLVSRVSNGSEI